MRQLGWLKGVDGRILFWAILIGSVIRPYGAAAEIDYQIGLMVTEEIYAQHNYRDRIDNSFTIDRTYNLLTVSPLLNLSLSRQIAIFLSGDLQWTYEPDPPSDGFEENEIEGTWTAANLTLGDRPLQTRLGIQAINFGSNLITVDEVPAARLTAAMGRWSLDLQAARVMEKSPMAGVNLAYEPGFLEHLNLFGAWFNDKEDLFAKSLPDLYQLLDPTSSGQLWWMGAAAQLFLGKVLLNATAIYEQGDVRFEHALGETERDVAAFLVDVGLEGNIGDAVSLGLFFFAASGDDDARDHTLKSFVSPLPYNTRATIFFDPEWLDRNVDDQLMYGGATFNGVLAPGITLTLAPMEELLVTATLATFYPHEEAQGGRDWYGWEADLDISYTFKGNFELFLEAAWFEHGNYFQDLQGNTPDASLLFTIGGRALIRQLFQGM